MADLNWQGLPRLYGRVIYPPGSLFWRYPRPGLFFVEFRGVQYAVVEQSSDDALNIVEHARRLKDEVDQPANS